MRWHSVVERSVFLLAYGLLHDQPEQFSGIEERSRRTLDVNAGSEQGSGSTELCGRLQLDVGVDVL